MLSIQMIKLCGNSICKPLSIIFNDCLKEGKFPSDWKKAHVVPVHKKGDKQCLKIIDLFPYFQSAAKFLSVSFIMSFSPFFTDNNLISPNQSGFTSANSGVNQWIAITHEIYESFDDGLEVRGVFLYISKAFDICMNDYFSNYL